MASQSVRGVEKLTPLGRHSKPWRPQRTVRQPRVKDGFSFQQGNNGSGSAPAGSQLQPKPPNTTLKTKLTTEPNDGESLVLKWKLEEPLEVGEGGIIRFKTRVR